MVGRLLRGRSSSAEWEGSGSARSLGHIDVSEPRRVPGGRKLGRLCVATATIPQSFRKEFGLRRPAVGSSAMSDVAANTEPPRAHVRIVYLGPVAPHWEVIADYGDRTLL